MKKRLLVGFIAGLFLILISLSSVSAADWKETFDTDVLASGQWVSYELDHPPGGHNVEWKIVQGFLGGHFDADLSGIAYYNGGSTWKDYEVVAPNFMVSNAEFGGVGIAFRVQNKDNFYYVTMKGDGNILELGKRINGIYKRRIVTVWTEEWFYGPITFRVNVSGNNIKVHINDAPKINYDDLTDPFLTGSVGAFAISEGWIEGMIWDEFQVTLGFIDIGLRVYDGTSAITIACEPQGTLTSPLRISKNGQTYGIALVDPSDPMASKIRIQTSSGIKALRKF